MLSSLVRLPLPRSPSLPVADIFASAPGLIFTDDLCNSHGNPGSSIVYSSKQYGDLEFTLADPEGEDERRLFAHYLWDSSIQIGEFLGSAQHEEDECFRKWNINGERVLELGAGTGLAGIVSALAGAQEVTITDYPAQAILDSIKTNVVRNIPAEQRRNVTVVGHEWGTFTNDFAKSCARSFTRILSADCLWMPWQHQRLAQSMLHFLSPSPNARVWAIAGFHTGRAKLALFFDVAATEGLQVEEIWERDVDGNERAWAAERDREREDVTGRKRWLVIAILRRQQPQSELF